MYVTEITHDKEANTFGYTVSRTGRVRAKGLGYSTRFEAERQRDNAIQDQKDLDEATR